MFFFIVLAPYVTQNSGVRISISSRKRHLYRGFNTASATERLGSGLPSAYECLGSRELKQFYYWRSAIRIL